MLSNLCCSAIIFYLFTIFDTSALIFLFLFPQTLELWIKHCRYLMSFQHFNWFIHHLLSTVFNINYHNFHKNRAEQKFFRPNAWKIDTKVTFLDAKNCDELFFLSLVASFPVRENPWLGHAQMSCKHRGNVLQQRGVVQLLLDFRKRVTCWKYQCKKASEKLAPQQRRKASFCQE